MVFANASRLSVWEVHFDGRCAVAGWDFCPDALGDVAMLAADSSGLLYDSSPYERQTAPVIIVTEALKGTTGNLITGSSGDEIVAFSASHQQMPTYGIAMAETQRLRCAYGGAQTGHLSGGGGQGYRGGNFSISVLNEATGFWETTTNVSATINLMDLKAALEGLPGIKNGLTISGGNNGGRSLCCDSPIISECEWVTIAFGEKNKYTRPSLEFADEHEIQVEVEETITGVDSLKYRGDGVYELKYTPTVAGNYTFTLKVSPVKPGTANATDFVHTELSAGLVVAAGPASGPQSPLELNLRATAGVRSSFDIHARDRFGNRLGRGLTAPAAAFAVKMNGTGFIGGGRESERELVRGVVRDKRTPNTDGLMVASFVPHLAGSHVQTVTLVNAGGLKATYFTKKDFTAPVLGSNGWRRWPYHEPKWCAPESLSPCDSTKLEGPVDLDFGGFAPLDDVEAPGFPADYWSLRLEGFVLAPASGPLTLRLRTRQNARVTFDGKIVADTLGISKSVTDIRAWNVTAVAGRLYPITIDYVEDTGPASLVLESNFDGEKAGADFSVVPASHLYYERHVMRSPAAVLVYPDKVAAATTMALGDEKTECTALETCDFVVTATDADGNYRLNTGADTFVVEIIGTGDWAGAGRTNEYDGPEPIIVTGATQTPVAWEFLGTGSMYANTSRLYNFSGVDATTFGSLQRGDTLSIGLATSGSNDVRDEDLSPEFIRVASEGDFYANGTGPVYPSSRVREMAYNINYPSIPLADVWRGRTMHSVRIYRGASGGDTARHTIAYYPYVRGTYDLDVRVKQTSEVQELRTTVGKGRHLGGNFTLSLTAVDKFGVLSTSRTNPIPFDATNDELERALQDGMPNHLTLVNVTGPVSRSMAENGTSWNIEFLGVYPRRGNDLPLLVFDGSKLSGNRAAGIVTELVKGVPEQSIVGAPFPLVVQPNSAQAAWSTAYGQGLVRGTAGEVSSFTIVAKDAWGNTRFDDQPQSKFRVLAFAEDTTLGDQGGWYRPNAQGVRETPTAVVGQVAYNGDGEYAVEFTPEASGPTTVAVAMQQTVEVQAITWNASAPTQLDAYDEHGGIVLSIGGKDADEIAWDSTAEDVAQAISGLGWGDVEVSRGVFKGTDEMRMYDAAALRGLQIDNAHYVYSITFSDYVGDVPELEVLEPRGGSLRVDWDQGVTTKEITKGSFGVVKASDAWPVRSRPWVNDQLVREVQVVRVDHGVTHSEGNFTLTFKGQETRHIPVNATAGQVKRALEELETVGQVDVARRGNPATGSNAGGTTRLDNYEWAVTFGRGRGTEVDLTNLGDQPSMGGRNVTQTSTDSVRRSTSPITVYTSGAVSSGGVATVDGVAPFASVVYPNAVSAPNCTAVDLSGVAGRDGLKTGFFERASSFIIEARDAFGNMNPYGPRAEVQVVDVFSNTPAAANHSGNAFSLSYLGEAVEVPFGAGVKDLEDLLESLPEVGAVTVTTTGATHDVKCRANATFGVAVIEPSCDLRTTFGPGDWIRVGHNESYGRLRNEDAKNLKPWAASPERGSPDAHTHVFTVVRVAQKAPYAITLSGPWPYASDANVALYEQGRNEKNARDAYRYVVTFDTLLGDLPPLVATPLSTKFATDVTYCERYRYQEIRTHEQGVNNTHQHYEFQQAADRDFKVGSNYVNGTFTLSFGGQTTRQLPSNIEPAALKTALEDDLDDVITASVIYRRGPFGPGEYKWLVRLDATVGDVLEPMYAEGYLLTGAHASVVADDDTCPEAPDNGAGEKAASQAGRLGTQFVARLSGPESVNADVTYAGQGLYDATYATPRIGSYLVDVSATEQGGLVGQYFNNRWLYGEPVFTRVDHSVDFEFEVEDTITDTGRDHVSVRWTGFVRPSFDEIFTFHAQVNDGARLFVDGELLFDAFENEVDEAGGIPYEEFSGARPRSSKLGH
jgi:hypothetical protein